MMMNNDDLLKAVEEYREWKEVMEQAEKQMKIYEASIKGFMEERNFEECPVGRYIVRFKHVESRNFDKTAFRKDFPEMYDAYMTTTSSKRFKVSE